MKKRSHRLMANSPGCVDSEMLGAAGIFSVPSAAQKAFTQRGRAATKAVPWPSWPCLGTGRMPVAQNLSAPRRIATLVTQRPQGFSAAFVRKFVKDRGHGGIEWCMRRWASISLLSISLLVLSSCGKVRATDDAPAAVTVGVTKVVHKSLSRQITL